MFYVSDALHMENCEEESKFWNSRNTKLFLNLNRERKEKFRDPKIKKKNLWSEISCEMKKYRYNNMSEDVLDKKLRNLKKTYRNITDNKRSTGRGRISWQYYDIFEEIFHNDRTINFGSSVSSMNRPTAITHCSSSIKPTSAASYSTTLIASPTPTSPPSRSVEVIASSFADKTSPSVRRYMRHTPIEISTLFSITESSTYSTDFADAASARNLFLDKDILNCSFSSFSSCSSCSVTTGSEYYSDSNSNRSLPRQRRNAVKGTRKA